MKKYDEDRKVGEDFSRRLQNENQGAHSVPYTDPAVEQKYQEYKWMMQVDWVTLSQDSVSRFQREAKGEYVAPYAESWKEKKYQEYKRLQATSDSLLR